MQGNPPDDPRRREHGGGDGQRGPAQAREAPRQQDEKPRRSQWEAADAKRRRALIVRLVVGLVLLILFVIFVSSNSDSVQVDFIFVETRTPLVWVFLICALVGGIVAYLLGRSGRRSTRKYIKELERKLEGKGDRKG